MRVCTTILSILFFGCSTTATIHKKDGATAAPQSPADRSTVNERAEDSVQPSSSGCSAIKDELLAMMQADQEARRALTDAGLEKPDTVLAARVLEIDAKNTARMKEILRNCGWPDRSMVGKDGAMAAFLLVQHADQDPVFQKEAVQLLLEAYQCGEASANHLALLIDRILLAEGKPQLYGTQALIQNGKIVLRPVHDPENLDKRRLKMGLQPIAEYLELMKRAYGLGAEKGD